jgi:putative spermidine/putrescine transport system ATP-binding protein
MGGHNVLDTPAGPIAVRNDHMQIAPLPIRTPAAASGLAAHVTDVEYQGTYVLLGLALDGRRPRAPDRLGAAAAKPPSSRAPMRQGDAVRLSWAEADTRVLGAQRPDPAATRLTHFP